MKKPLKLIAALTAAIMSLSSLVAVVQAEETSNDTLVLMDATDTERYDDTTKFSGVTLNTNKHYTYEDRAASARFKIKANKSNTAKFYFDEAVDVTKYTTMVFRMYSDKATGNLINFLLYDEAGEKYWRLNANQNWTGWKDVRFALNATMNFTSWDANKSITASDAIGSVQLNLGGWSNSANILAANIYIDSIFVNNDFVLDSRGLSNTLNTNKDTTHLGEVYASSAKISVDAGKEGSLHSGRGNGTDRLQESWGTVDISKFKTLNANIYNVNAASDANLHMVVYSQADRTGNYYAYDLPLTWTGWKTVSIDLDAPAHTKTSVDGAGDPRKVMSCFALNVGAWSHKNNAVTNVECYVDCVWFSEEEGSNVIFDAADGESIDIFGMTETEVGGVPAGDFAGTGENVIKETSLRKSLLDYGIAKDWTSYDKLTMLVYANDYDDGDVLEIVPRKDSDNYFIYKLPIDWSGWKEISVPLKSFEMVGTASWDNIMKFTRSYGKYGGSQTSEYTDLCFDKIVLQKTNDTALTGNLAIEKDKMGIYSAKATMLTSERNVPYEIFLAATGSDGVFKSVVSDSAASTGLKRVDLTASYTPDDNADIKAMLWDSVSGMKPYTAPVSR